MAAAPFAPTSNGVQRKAQTPYYTEYTGGLRDDLDADLYRRIVQLKETLLPENESQLPKPVVHAVKASWPASADPVLQAAAQIQIAAISQLRARRQQIEDGLRYDEAAQPRPSPEIDAADILRRAQILQPPVSGFPDPDAASESFDENDYYSSNVDSPSQSSKESKEVNELMDDAENESDAMAISSPEEDEVSEDEFEPAVEAPQVSVFQAVPSTPPEWRMRDNYPDTMVETAEEDDYEPPSADSPQYEPDPAQLSLQLTQQSNAFAVPHAISLNQIESPAAPQPSYISPLTNTNISHQLDFSNDHSSKSGDETGQPPKQGKKKGKRAKQRALAYSQNQTQAQLSQPQMQSRGLKRGRMHEPSVPSSNINQKTTRKSEATAKRLEKRQKRRSQGQSQPNPAMSGSQFIKEESSPPAPFAQSQLPLQRSERETEYYGEDDQGYIRRMAEPPPKFQPPPGYKLVPIDDEPDYEPEHLVTTPHAPRQARQHQQQTPTQSSQHVFTPQRSQPQPVQRPQLPQPPQSVQNEPPRPFHRALLRDEFGNEYYADQPTYSQPPPARQPPSTSYEAPYSEPRQPQGQWQPQPYQQTYEPEQYQPNIMAPPPVAQRYPERPSTAVPDARPYNSMYQRPQEQFTRDNSGYAPHTPQVEPRPQGQQPVYDEPYVPRTPQARHPSQMPQQHMAQHPAPPQAHAESYAQVPFQRPQPPYRAQSVHPQSMQQPPIYSDSPYRQQVNIPPPMRQASVAPSPLNPGPPMFSRAASAYPMPAQQQQQQHGAAPQYNGPPQHSSGYGNGQGHAEGGQEGWPRPRY
ncbi:hypothetical protein BT63DRAFT_425521 [Microthyrium microscopicum]|uniref:Uncharacterized protein n=1 Tax=Microthyrium microscopicum TaxID=703497 RepID=A0A6A6U8B4_9PEZI|nr:hypothetical protein BT63DRAFT_425521 [Microthyrium microscopicum]